MKGNYCRLLQQLLHETDIKNSNRFSAN